MAEVADVSFPLAIQISHVPVPAGTAALHLWESDNRRHVGARERFSWRRCKRRLLFPQLEGNCDFGEALSVWHKTARILSFVSLVCLLCA